MARKLTTARQPAGAEHHHLAELVDFRPDQGIMRLHEQRVVLLSAAAMGLLRKELIDTLGVETARRVFLRFGFADGYHDAVSLRDRQIRLGYHRGICRSGVVSGNRIERRDGQRRGRRHKIEFTNASRVYGQGIYRVIWDG